MRGAFISGVGEKLATGTLDRRSCRFFASTKAAYLHSGRARIAELYPWLPAVTFAETWRGLIAVTSDQLPRP